MPKIKSAKKALRQNLRRKKQNLRRKTNLKKTIQTFKGFIKTGKLKEAKNYLNQIYKLADKTAKTNAIKKGKADRIKSRLSKLLVKKSS